MSSVGAISWVAHKREQMIAGTWRAHLSKFDAVFTVSLTSTAAFRARSRSEVSDSSVLYTEDKFQCGHQRAATGSKLGPRREQRCKPNKQSVRKADHG